MMRKALFAVFSVAFFQGTQAWFGPNINYPQPYKHEGDALASECKNSVTSGWLTITVDGKKKNVTVMSEWPPLVNPSGESVTVKHNGNGFLANGCHDSWSPDNFEKWNLLGKRISWVSNIKDAGCGCNASPFLAAMPAIGKNGKPQPGSGKDYICDAPTKPGCFEFDSYEANKYAFQTTSHVCHTFNNATGFMSNCTGLANSCSQNTKNTFENEYGPGENYKINTLKSVWTGIFFLPDSSGKALQQVNIVIAQGSKSIVMRLNSTTCGKVGGAEYMKRLGDQLTQRDVGLIVCYWGGSGQRMSWLDVPPCSKSVACDGGQVTYSAFEIHTLKPEEYEW